MDKMFAVIDKETTGLLDEKSEDFMRQPGIVQLGVLILDSNMVEVDRLASLVNPDMSAAGWDEKAIEVHGIKPEDVLNSPSYMAIHPSFAELVRGCKYWVGFNNRFDRKVLWYQLLRYGLEKNFPWPPEEIDVMKVSKDKLNTRGKRGTKPVTLGEAYEALVGKPMEGAHDALQDIRGTAELLRILGPEILADRG